MECLTYRLADHTSADDASRYRSDEEVSRAWHAEPVSRLRSYLTQVGAWSEADEDSWIARCRQEVDKAAEDYLAMPPQAPQAIFDSLFATLPPALAAQRAMVEKSVDG